MSKKLKLLKNKTTETGGVLAVSLLRLWCTSRGGGGGGGELSTTQALFWPAGDSEAQNLNLVHITVQTPARRLVWAPVGATCGQEAPESGEWPAQVLEAAAEPEYGWWANCSGSGEALFEVIPICFLGEEGEDWAAKLKTVLYSHLRTELHCKWCG